MLNVFLHLTIIAVIMSTKKKADILSEFTKIPHPTNKNEKRLKCTHCDQEMNKNVTATALPRQKLSGDLLDEQ